MRLSQLKGREVDLLGEWQLARKVWALASGVGVLAAGWGDCGRAFGKTSAHVFAALYVFAPAAVQKLSLISLGIHHEASAFLLLSLGLTAALMERPRRRSPWRRTSAFPSPSEAHRGRPPILAPRSSGT